MSIYNPPASDAVGQYPDTVKTRPVYIGGAVSVEAGVPLTVHVRTESSRALIHRESGWRLEKQSYVSDAPWTGELVWWEAACTDESEAYLDAETHQVIVLGENEHTHRYTTTLTVYSGTTVVGEYVVGPYPVPVGDGSTFHIDTALIPDATTDGTLVPIPELWERIVADAQAVVADLGTAVSDVLTDPESSARGELDGLFVQQAAADSTVAAKMLAEGSATGAALNAYRPVHRIWDSVMGRYPARVPGAVNIFFGAEDPGLAMDADVDFWASSEVTTLDQVTSAVADMSSPLYAAVMSAAGVSEVNLQIGAPSNRTDASMGNFGEGATVIYAWTLAKGGANSVRFSGRIPVSWRRANLTAYWVREAGAGNVRISMSYSLTNDTGVVGSDGITVTLETTGPFREHTLKKFNIDVMSGKLISGSVTRLSDSAEDTSSGRVGVLAVVLERTA